MEQYVHCALALSNNWWRLPFIIFFNLTAKPHKVPSRPGIVLLYVQQPSFYKISEHKL